MRQSLSKHRVAVVYHFFPHYRAAVNEQLLHCSRHDYLLVGDPQTLDPTIKAWEITDPSRFVIARCWQPYPPLMIQHGLVRLALRRDLDTIIYHGNAYWPSTWVSAAIARLTGKRVLYWTQGWVCPDQGAKRWLRRTFYKLAHGLLLYGHVAKMIGIAEGFPPESLHVIYNSLDYQRQKESRAGVTRQRIDQVRRRLFGHASDRPVVICTSRLAHVRRLDLLLEAMAILKEQGHQVNGLLVGDGPERTALEQLARHKALDVVFYGPCYDEQVLAELVMSSTVTVAPGKVGLTAMHSLAFGTPVVTHDDPDHQMPEWEAIVAGRTGGFFKRDDPHDLARAIKQWTQASLPDDQCRSQCFRIIDRFYNAPFQRRAIDRAVEGKPADDLFWMKKGLPPRSVGGGNDRWEGDRRVGKSAC